MMNEANIFENNITNHMFESNQLSLSIDDIHLNQIFHSTRINNETKVLENAKVKRQCDYLFHSIE